MNFGILGHPDSTGHPTPHDRGVGDDDDLVIYMFGPLTRAQWPPNRLPYECCCSRPDCKEEGEWVQEMLSQTQQLW